METPPLTRQRLIEAGMRVIGYAATDIKFAVLAVSRMGHEFGRSAFVDAEQTAWFRAIEKVVRSGAEEIGLVEIDDIYQGSDFRGLTACCEVALGAPPEREIDILLEAHRWRRAGTVLEHLANAAKDAVFRERIGIETIEDLAKAFTEDFAEIKSAGETTRTAQRIDEFSETIEAYRRAKDDERPPGYSWGISTMDRFGRIPEVGLVVIAALSKSGKTKLAVQLGHRLAERENVQVYHCPLEMGAEETFAWYVSRHYSTDSATIGTPDMLEPVLADLEAQSDLFGLPVTIDDTPGLSLSDISQRVREWKLRGAACRRAVIVDYIQLLNLERDRGESEAAALKRVAYGLHELAQSEQVLVLATAQLNRQAEHDSRSTLAHLEGGGGIAQAAKTIVIIDSLPRRYGQDQPDRWRPENTPLWVQVTQRGARSFSDRIVADLTTGRFRGADRDDDPMFDPRPLKRTTGAGAGGGESWD